MVKFIPHIFQCKYCGQIHKSIVALSSLRCDAGFYHSWTDLGLEGNITFECQKCATVVKVSKTPQLPNCPSGNSHIWKKII